MTGELSPADRRRRAKERRQRILANLQAAGRDVRDAAAEYKAGLADRDWEDLGETFEAWRDSILRGLELPKEVRQDIALMLATEQQMTVRPIGELLGVSQTQAAKDINAAADRAGVNKVDTSNPRSDAARARPKRTKSSQSSVDAPATAEPELAGNEAQEPAQPPQEPYGLDRITPVRYIITALDKAGGNRFPLRAGR